MLTFPAKLSDTPKDLGFDTDYHVSIFVIFFMFINHDDLEYQDGYPLTGGNEREGCSSSIPWLM
jgi:hypothetical protein